MDLEESPDALIESGVLSAGSAGTVELSEGYLRSVGRYERLSADERAATLGKRTEDAERVVGSVADSELIAHLCALSEWLSEAPFETLVPTALVIQAFEVGPPPAAGVPEGFVPVLGAQLDSVIALHRQALVYVWREDCPPCEVMREDLETLDAELTDDVGQFAVYGPNWATQLEQTYDVTGGPVLLFAADGAVRSRLYGSQYSTVIESELRSLRAVPE
jgi:thiol-disulfide isomerase/thioredoxin